MRAHAYAVFVLLAATCLNGDKAGVSPRIGGEKLRSSGGSRLLLKDAKLNYKGHKTKAETEGGNHAQGSNKDVAMPKKEIETFPYSVSDLGDPLAESLRCWRDSDCSSGRCEGDWRCHDKLDECHYCDEHSDCKSDVCTWGFKCGGSDWKYKNGCACNLDLECRSGMCDWNYKCRDKLGVDEGTCFEDEDCKHGLSCPFPMAKCYDDPREMGQPCNLLNDNCAPGLQCFPTPFLGKHGTSCVPRLATASCISGPLHNIEQELRSLSPDATFIENLKGLNGLDTETLNSMFMPFIRDGQEEASALLEGLYDEIHSCMEDIVKASFVENAESIDARLGAEEAYDFGLTISAGYTFDASFLMVGGFSFSFGWALSPFGTENKHGGFRTLCSGAVLGMESSLGFFLSLGFHKDLDKLSGTSFQIFGMDFGPVVTGMVDGGFSFSVTESDPENPPYFTITGEIGLGAGLDIEILHRCNTILYPKSTDDGEDEIEWLEQDF